AEDRDAARGQAADAAGERDQRGLAGAVGAEEGENLALLDLEADALQRLEARVVDLADVPDGDGGWHRLVPPVAEPRRGACPGKAPALCVTLRYASNSLI